jgi:hypothetical protein
MTTRLIVHQKLRTYGLTGRVNAHNDKVVDVDAFNRHGVNFPATKTSVSSLLHSDSRPGIMRHVDIIAKCHAHALTMNHRVLSYTPAGEAGASNMMISVANEQGVIAKSRSNNYWFQKKDPFLKGGYDSVSHHGGFFYCTLQLEVHPYLGIGITSGPHVEPRLVTHRYAGVKGPFDVWFHEDGQVARDVESEMKKLALPKSIKRPKGFQTEALPVGLQPYMVHRLKSNGMKYVKSVSV